MTGGVYDLLHPGHIEHLRVARALGEVVVVGLWSDAHVAARKGADRPFNSIDDRLTLIDSLKFVDYVLEMEGEGRRSEIIRPLVGALEPDYYLLSDRNPSLAQEPYVEHEDGRVTSIVHDVTYAHKHTSTTDIAARIRDSAHVATQSR